MGVLALRLYLLKSADAPVQHEIVSSPSVSISVGPEYQAFKSGSSRSRMLTPSMAAMGMKVVLLELNPAETRNGFIAAVISSYRSCDQDTYLVSSCQHSKGETLISSPCPTCSLPQ